MPSLGDKFLAYIGGFASITLAVLLAVAGFKIHALTVDLAAANGDKATLEHNLGQCHTNSAVLEGSMNTRNAEVDGLSIAATAAANAAKAGQAAHEAAAAAEDARAQALSNLPPLPAGADHCAAASALIRTTLAAEHSK